MIPAVVIKPFAPEGLVAGHHNARLEPSADPEHPTVVHLTPEQWVRNASCIRTLDEHEQWLAETAEERAAERARAAEEAEAARLEAERLAAEEAARQAAEAEEQRQREEEAARFRAEYLARHYVEVDVLENVMTGGIGPHDEHAPIKKGTRVHLRPQIFLRLARRGFVKAARDHKKRFAEVERAERANNVEQLRKQIGAGGPDAPAARRALEALAGAHPEVRVILDGLDNAEQAARDTLEAYTKGAA